MVRSFFGALPDCPQYGGAHPDPHLTVGSGLEPRIANSVANALLLIRVR